MKRCFRPLILVFVAFPVHASAQTNPLGKALIACIVQAVEENKPLEKGLEGVSAQIPCYDDGAKYLFDALGASGTESSSNIDGGGALIIRRFGEDQRPGASQCERKVPAAGKGDDIYSCWIRLDVGKDAMTDW